MIDVEEEIIEYLGENLECEAYAEVPNPRPERFVTVERTGGHLTDNGAIDRPTVAVQTWAESRSEAASLAAKVAQLLLVMPYETVNVMRCECNSLYNFPDPDSRQSRYQGIYDLVTT